MDLPILAGIGEAEYVWIPICFKGLMAFSCRHLWGVWHTPHRCPGYGANDFVRYAPNGPFGPARGAYAIRPYSLPAGGVFSYGRLEGTGKRVEEDLLSGFFFSSLDGRKEGKRRSRPLPRPGKLAGYRMYPKRDGEGIADIMDLPILAGIGEAEYVWIPICFKGLKAFSCR